MNNILLSSVYFQKWTELNSLKPSTIEDYKRHLADFGDYLFSQSEGSNEELNFEKFYYSDIEDEYAPIDIEFFDGYIEYLHDNKPPSQAKKAFTVVKSFFNLLLNYDLLEYNPIGHFKNPFYYESFRNRALSELDCLKLLKAALELDPFLKQYYLLILLQTTCGLRAKELCKLTVSKIDIEKGIIHVNKGQKRMAGSVRLTPALIQQITKYLEHPFFLQWANGRDCEVFFKNGRPLQPVDVNNIINDIRIHAKISRKVTNHDLRATMAYLLFKEGVHLREIQKQLRHKQLKTTLGYLPIHIELDGYL